MNLAVSKLCGSLAVAGLLVSSGCGGSDGGTPPVTVASVAITSPASAPSIGALGHSVQFTAVAKDGAGATIAGATIAWASSSAATATVSAAGLVTAVANGTTQITASSGGQTSTFVVVTVQQVPLALNITPASVTFGAFGSSRQFTASVVDSANAPIPGGAVTWVGATSGKTSLSVSGLLTAVGNTTLGVADSIHAQITSGGTVFTGTATAVVLQVVGSVTVTATSPGPDSLMTTTRTRQYAATAKDSNGNVMGSAPITWTSSAPAVATIGSSTGLAAAVADGSTNITATSGTVNGIKALVVRRYASTFTIAPTSANITTSHGTQLFNGTAQDSLNTNLPITWASSVAAVATINSAAGTSTTATAASNGTTNVVMSGGTRSVSALVTVTNQVVTTAAVSVGDDFFKSGRNLTTNPAVDTVAIGGTVTWTFIGAVSHSVQSIGSPSFSSGPIQLTGTYALVFNTVGTYTYNCIVHGNAMTGTVVVR